MQRLQSRWELQETRNSVHLFMQLFSSLSHIYSLILMWMLYAYNFKGL